MIIDRDGLFNGDRLALCSNAAHLHFPFFLLSSDGFARLELNYDLVVGTAFLRFHPRPTEKKFWSYMEEYWRAWLLFVWSVDGRLWGQWDCPAEFLPRYKTAEERRRPVPPEEILTEWLKKARSGSKSLRTEDFRNISGLCASRAIPTPTPTSPPEVEISRENPKPPVQQGPTDELRQAGCSVSPARSRANRNGYDPLPGWERFRGADGYPCIPDFDAACRAWVSAMESAEIEAAMWAGLAEQKKSQRAADAVWWNADNYLLRRLWRGKLPPAKAKQSDVAQQIREWGAKK